MPIRVIHIPRSALFSGWLMPYPLKPAGRPDRVEILHECRGVTGGSTATAGDRDAPHSVGFEAKVVVRV